MVKSVRNCVYSYVTHTILTILVNLSLLNETFPSAIKSARLFFLHKGGSRYDPFNYRTIFLLSASNKIFEKCLCSRPLSFLDKKKNISSITIRLVFTINTRHNMLSWPCWNSLTRCINKGRILATIFINVRKAFDSISHTMLLSKQKTLVCGEAVINGLKIIYQKGLSAFTLSFKINSVMILVSLKGPSQDLFIPYIHLWYFHCHIRTN